MMGKAIFTIALISLLYACTAEGFDPIAEFDITLRQGNLPKLESIIATFSELHDFELLTSDRLPKNGRSVIQFYLNRRDGVSVTIDNFSTESAFHVSVYNKDQSTDEEVAMQVAALLADEIKLQGFEVQIDKNTKNSCRGHAITSRSKNYREACCMYIRNEKALRNY